MGPVDHNCVALLTKVQLRIRHQIVNPQIAIAHDNILKKANAIYPIIRTEVKTAEIKSTTLKFTQVLSTGKLPNKLIFALVEAKAVTGVENLNPYNFQNFEVRELVFRVDGSEAAYKKLELNYNDNLYTQGYMTYFDANPVKVESGCNITIKDFPNGYATYHINLHSAINGCDGEVNFPQKTGKLHVEITFDKTISKEILGIWLMEWNDVIEIDADLKGLKPNA